MKCPICGQELKPGKKDPNYLLCYNCKKKFKVPAQKASGKTEKKEVDEEEIHAPKYANIPPKHVREKREQESAAHTMRCLLSEMVRKRKTNLPWRVEEPEDDFYEDDYEDEKMSKGRQLLSLPLLFLLL